MVKRKKKENTRKKSLLFVESPVESRQRPSSPVACVDNPVTAVPVPIDSDSSILWVSPQFTGIKLPEGRRRQTRQRRNVNSRRGESSNKENSRHQHRINTQQKFPALDFVGNRAKPSRKVGRQQATKSDRVTERQDEVVPQQNIEAANIHQKSKAGKRRVTTIHKRQDYDAVETFRRDVPCRNSEEILHLPHARRSTVGTDSADSPQNSSPDERAFPVFTHIHPDPSDSQSAGQSLHSSSHEMRRKRRKSYNSEILQSPPETNLPHLRGKSLKTKQLHSSPAGTGTNQVPLRIALFPSSPSEDHLFNNTNNSQPVPSASKSQDNSLKSGLLSVRDMKSSRRRNKAEQRKPSQSSQSLCQGKGARQSKRLQEKYKKALKYIHPQGSQPDTPDRHIHILVADTPENEKDLTYRQRQYLKV